MEATPSSSFQCIHQSTSIANSLVEYRGYIYSVILYTHDQLTPIYAMHVTIHLFVHTKK